MELKILKNVKMKKTVSEKWPRTIAPDLHEAWLKLKRKKDAAVIMAAIGYSRPVIDRALNYGFVSMPELTDKINKFFLDRLKKESQTGSELIALHNQLEKNTNGVQQ